MGVNDYKQQSRIPWQIGVWNGSIYVAGATIYRPNENFTIGITCSMKKISLANGSNGYFTPSTLYTNDALSFVWLEILEGDPFKTTIEGYVKNANQLQITTHLGETYTGQFISSSRVWISGMDDTYDYTAVFERTLG